MAIGSAGFAVGIGGKKQVRQRPLKTFLSRYFYFSTTLVMAGLVVWGFSRTVDAGLLHANPPRPLFFCGFMLPEDHRRFAKPAQQPPPGGSLRLNVRVGPSGKQLSEPNARNETRNQTTFSTFSFTDFLFSGRIQR